MIETINKLNRISRQMLQEMGREPTPEELAERMLMPEDKIRKVLKIAKEPMTDTFAGNVKLFTHFFQRVVGVHIDTETHTQYFRFTGGQASQNVVRGSTQALGGGSCHHREPACCHARRSGWPDRP